MRKKEIDNISAYIKMSESKYLNDDDDDDDAVLKTKSPSLNKKNIIEKSFMKLKPIEN